MVSTAKSASFFVLAAACFIDQCQPFTPNVPSFVRRRKFVLAAASSAPLIVNGITERHFKSRRSFVTCSFAATFGIAASLEGPKEVLAADGNLYVILGQLKEGRDQLECVPDLIKAEKWDAGKYFSQDCTVNDSMHVLISYWHSYMLYHSTSSLD